MKDHSRRSFVKTSAATGLTFTFAGLIRAHGQSGGGTTWNPEVTFGSTFGTDKTLEHLRSLAEKVQNSDIRLQLQNSID